MPLDLRPYHNRVWLMDQSNMYEQLHKLNLFKSCMSAREVVKAKRKRLDHAARVGEWGTTKTANGISRSAPKGDLVAVVPVMGPIDHRMSSALEKVNGCSCEELGTMMDVLAMDDRISTIVLEIDSGGGSSAGLKEVADKIFGMRKQKKLYAIANTFAASAAYWIMTAAETLVCVPSGEVGSVGAYTIHSDQTAAIEADGIKISMFKAGKFKAETAPWVKLTDEAKDHLQEAVDEVYSKFVKDVARNRGTTIADVRANYGQGRVFGAEVALSFGMVDAVMPMDQLLEKLTGGKVEEQPRVERQRAAGASAEVLRSRREFEMMRRPS